MAAISVLAAPTNALATPGIPTGIMSWGSKISAAIQAAGITKTKLNGFGDIYPRISLNYFQAAASIVSPNFQVPLNVQINDFMLVTVTALTTVATPAGWTAIRNDAATGGTGPVQQYTFYRFATSADVTGAQTTQPTYTFTLGNTALIASATFVAYVGVNTSSPINVTGLASSSTNGTTATAPSVTTTATNCLVVQCWAADMATNTLAFSAGTIRSYIPSLGSNSMNAVTDSPQAATGASAQPTATLGATGSWLVQTIALAPAAPSFTFTIADSATGGSLADSTVAYRISAYNVQGETWPCAEVTHVIANGTGTSTATPTWPMVPNATGYKVYGRASGSELLLATVPSPNGSVLSWTDNGSLTPSGVLNATDTTMDTGQVNWGTVATLGSGSTKSGYEIYQLTDSLQATGAPVFIRLDYGSSGTSASSVQMWVTVGTSTDGAGNITAGALYPNALGAARTLFNNTGVTVTTVVGTIYVDSDGGSSLMIAGWNAVGGGQSNGCVMVAERTRNWDGTPNINGLMVFCASPAAAGVSASATTRVLIIAAAASYTQPAQVSSAIAFTGLGNAIVPQGTALVGTTVYTWPIFTGSAPMLGGPSKHLVGVYSGDLPANYQFQVTVYGAVHTFVALGQTGAYANWNGGGTVLWSLATLDTLTCGAFRIS